MQKLKREIEVLERGMQRVKMRLGKIQPDPLLTPATSLTGIKWKQLIGPECHDYSEYDQYTEYMTKEQDIHTEQNDLAEEQIRTDALLARQLQEEEWGHV